MLMRLCGLDSPKAFTNLESFLNDRSPKPQGESAADTNPVRLIGLIDSFQTTILCDPVNRAARQQLTNQLCGGTHGP